jgi:hypothetical protein
MYRMDSRWIHVLFNSGDELTQFLFYLSCFSLLVAIVSGARGSAVVLFKCIREFLGGAFWKPGYNSQSSRFWVRCLRLAGPGGPPE